jgi:hypothetical protein
MQRRVGNAAVTEYLAQSRVSVQREGDEEELQGEDLTETELTEEAEEPELETTEDFAQPMPKRSAWSKAADRAKSYGGGVKEMFNLAGFGRIGAGFKAGRKQANRGGASASTLARGFSRAAKKERGIPITEAEEIPQFGAGYAAGRATRAAINGPTQLWNLVADVIGNPKALWRRIVSRFRKGAGAVNFGEQLEPEL